MEEEKKDGRGGVRAGAGRKTGWHKSDSARTRNIGIRVSEEELKMIKEKATASGKGLTDFIVDLVRTV